MGHLCVGGLSGLVGEEGEKEEVFGVIIGSFQQVLIFLRFTSLGKCLVRVRDFSKPL